jgi:hypothetical protein
MLPCDSKILPSSMYSLTPYSFINHMLNAGNPASYRHEKSPNNTKDAVFMSIWSGGAVLRVCSFSIYIKRAYVLIISVMLIIDCNPM